MDSSVVSTHRLKIFLSADESAEPHALNRFLTAACLKTGFSPKNDRLLIETIPQRDGGHTVCVTRLPGTRTAFGKQAKQTEPYIFSFDALDDLLFAGQSVLRHPEILLYRLSVFYRRKTWYLTFSPVLAGLDGYRLDCLLGSLCEFGREERGGTLRELRLREEGRLVAEDDEAVRLFQLTAAAKSEATACEISGAPKT